MSKEAEKKHYRLKCEPGKFQLKIELGNDAMRTPEDIAHELEWVLFRVQAGVTEGVIRDINGNLVGGWSYALAEEDE